MRHLLTPALLKGYTSGLSLNIADWDMFLQFYKITNLRDELIRYSGPSNWIADILN